MSNGSFGNIIFLFYSMWLWGLEVILSLNFTSIAVSIQLIPAKTPSSSSQKPLWSQVVTLRAVASQTLFTRRRSQQVGEASQAAYLILRRRWASIASPQHRIKCNAAATLLSAVNETLCGNEYLPSPPIALPQGSPSVVSTKSTDT